MKKTTIAVMSAVLILAAGQALAMGPGGGRGKGSPMRGLKRMLKNPEACEKLELTEEQTAQLDVIAKNCSKQVRGLRKAEKRARLALEQTLLADQVDKAAVMSAADEVGAASTAVRKAELGAWLDVREILSEEQAEQLEDMAQKHREQRGRKGHGRGNKGKGGRKNRGMGGQEEPEPPEE